MGPFGTFFFLEPIERTVLWFGIVGWGLLLIAAAMSISESFAPSLSFRADEFWRLAVMPPVIVMPLYPVVAAYLAPQPMPVSLLEGIIACYLLGAIVSAARFAIRGAETVGETESQGPRLMKRLPGDLTGPILRLSGQDHFVEIVTAGGQHRVRMRLADAVEEMDGVEGLYTHRSHWIAREAIREVAREGGRHYVVSADEARIPVSRGKLPNLEQSGLV